MLHAWLQPYYEQFVTTLLQGRLPNSIIISGHEGLGGNALALEMARFYLCHEPSASGPCGHCASCQAFMRLNHPDLRVAYSSNAEEASNDLDFTADLMGLLQRKESTTRRSLRVDTMRQITEFLSQSAVIGGRGKVVIVEGAHLMSEGAANAILKTFEEPNEHTLIIMLSNSLESLLPTILSRATKIVLRDVPLEQSLSFLLDPQNQRPLLVHRLYGEESAAVAAEQDAMASCEGLQTPINQPRAEVALALNSYAPLSAHKMLLLGDDLKAMAVVTAIVQYVQSQGGRGNDHGIGVIEALKTLNKPLQSRLLSELILEVVKYKAYVSEDELPLVRYGQAQVLQYLPLEHLFDAMDKLRFIEERSPLVPSRAPIALVRAWLKALCTLPQQYRS